MHVFGKVVKGKDTIGNGRIYDTLAFDWWTQ